MAWGPIGVGDAEPSHHTFTVVSDAGVVSVYPLTGLSGSELEMHFQEQPPPPGNARVGTGTWTITNSSGGLADYYPSSADVATPGTYKIYPVVALSTGPKAFPYPLQILEILNLT
jgi:hypothetical protein